MIQRYLGEIAALLTAGCWTVSAMVFESAGKRVGSLSVNLIRLVIALLFLSLYTLPVRGMPLPLDAGPHEWFWLSLSGLVGFVMGDLFLFHAFVVIGSRISMLIMALVPLFTALIGWMLMGEVLTSWNIMGMALTIGGIVLVVLERKQGQRMRLSHPVSGILLALGGALGQATGLVLSKYGMAGYDPFASTQIRVIAGIGGFTVLFSIIRTWPRIFRALGDGGLHF